MVKIAIVGSREGFSEKQVHTTLWMLTTHLTTSGTIIDGIISGGARGVDKFAESFAKKFGCNLEIIRPINPSIKKDYILRNIKIVDKADFVIAFWDGKSKGTKSVIDYCQKKDKNLKVIR